MPEQQEIETAPEWFDDDLEMDCAMSDEDFDFEDEPGDDEPLAEVAEEGSTPTGNVPVWRLIEMSRENRFLQQELADFDTYEFDSYGDDFAGEYTH